MNYTASVDLQRVMPMGALRGGAERGPRPPFFFSDFLEIF